MHSLSIVAGNSTVRGMVMNRLGSSAGASIDLSKSGGNLILKLTVFRRDHGYGKANAVFQADAGVVETS